VYSPRHALKVSLPTSKPGRPLNWLLYRIRWGCFKKIQILGEIIFWLGFPIRYGSTQNSYDEDNKAVGGMLRVPFCGGWYAQRTLHLN
jgi:hypothetical protein